ncbi:MAG: NAD(P)-dependent glycerol-3-phosphate dehydrogenase [Planctomycetia bacterium]|nr:NAD(P)-dependent glycerol-3-phosphate dehydrogenase [Planctomycetia bacterium]
MPITFSVLGSGAWGTAIAILLASRPHHRVRLWSARAETGRALSHDRENVRLLPGVLIPDSVILTEDVAEAVDAADFWVSAVPTVHLRATMHRVRAKGGSPPAVVSLTKGIEIGTFARPSQILTEVLGTANVVVLSGPSHAEEVSRGLPTSVVAASADESLAVAVQQYFSTDRFRVYSNLDPVGVELAGALKNVMGLAAGICDGLGYGDNARAALMTRGLAEITRFGVAFGAEPATFAGLAGLGDLITTCVSPHGRNRAVGLRLGQGEKLDAILSSMNQVAEGVTTTKAVYERAMLSGLDLPICTEAYRVLYEQKPPVEAVTALMGRSPKGEQWPR